MNFDYLIIGAGSAGCVLANRLSENPKVSVCLLEAGPEDKSPLVHAPVGVVAILPTKHVNWAFKTVPQKGLNDRLGYQPRGKVLGGSSSINGMLYIRGHRTDYDDWANLGNSEWSYDKVLPYFRKSQDHFQGESQYHGSGGELYVGKIEPHPVTNDFIEAGLSLGYRANEDFNGAEQEGIGQYHVTIKNGRRWSTARGFLDPIRNERPNLTVLTGAQVEKVCLEDKRATGAVIRLKGKQETITANCEVILSAGAFGSPHLLMLSGIGPAEELQKHGIPMRHELDGVGKNLQDHPDVVLSYKSNDTSLMGGIFAGRAQVVPVLLPIRAFKDRGVQ